MGERKMGFKELKSINKTDNKIKKLDERLEYVNNIIYKNIETVSKYSSESANNGTMAESNPFNITIEQLGTYLLRSEEVDSCRDGDYSFFETEKDYRKVKIGSSSMAVVFGDNAGEYQVEDESIGSSDSLDYDFFCDKLIDIDCMSGLEISNLLKKGSQIIFSEELNPDIVEAMKVAHKEILRRLKDDTDISIVKMIIEGMKEMEIAKELGINQSSVNRRFFNICHKKLKR